MTKTSNDRPLKKVKAKVKAKAKAKSKSKAKAKADENRQEAARRALEEAAIRRAQEPKRATPKETGGQEGPEPTRYGDWEKEGIISDF